ncbi:MAG: hypothetical protein QF803_02080 [Gammaproteobacteria bacterium]|jgi:hypothetical protein|nr:hypothetical protein [Gammaproteobacteria bacterium]MDP6694385.1 hypothetical protein [Gammaproteobacteria bacterium]
MTARVFKGLVAVLILLAALFVYRDLFGLWFTDVDTFPLISTGRIDSAGAVIDIFTSPVMQGLMPNALYYRPLTSISWGVDASVWGLNPLGYHLTDLAIHIANSLLLFFLLRDMGQRLPADNAPKNPRVTRNDLAALAAAIIFAIHPVAMEVVPAIARRADLLYGLFLLLMLRSLHKALTEQRALDIGLATFFCVLAFASKDTALILPAIAIAFVFCFAEATTIRNRVTQCVRVCWPLVISAALFLGARTLVLGGIGGYADEEAWAHLPFASALSGSIRPILCTIFLSGNLDTCAYIPRNLLIGVAAVIFTSFALVGWRASHVSTPYPPLRFLAFATLSLFAITLLHAVTGTPTQIRTMYVALLFISIAMGWGFVILLQAILALGRLHDSRMTERALHTVAGIILIIATGSVLRGAWSGQYIGEWHTSAEAAKAALTDITEGMESVPPDSVIYLVNVPFRVSDGWNHPHPMRERPMLLEHSVQGFVDLTYPGKRLEVFALSYIRIPGEDPAAVASTISFQPEPARLDIQTGPEGTPARLIWWTGYARQSPWRDNSYRRIRSERRMLIDLNPDVAVKDQAVFFVYTGDRVVRRGTTPWIVKHLPSGS